ncbi:MAG: hypothetical protein HUU15_11925, partial [Candidatus Brocadiae bacterium]|nr:hypothetical protein [Candidatus Brocadiia bacterium]
MSRAWTPILALLLAAAASAEDPAAPDTPAAIAVRRLGSDDPEVRQEAREVLIRLKRAALPALEAGIASDDAEVSAVCRRLVRRLRDASIVAEGGPIPHGTPWCEARTRLVSVNFRATTWSDVADAVEADLGYRLRIVGGGIDQDGARTLTLRLDDVPLEFLLGTLLHRSLSEQVSGLPRIGWGRNTILFTADQKPQGDKVKTVYPAGSALRGIPPRDLEVIAEFLKRLAAEEGGDASASLDESGLVLSASPWIQTDASTLIDLARRAATGEAPPGAGIDAAAARAGLAPFTARWSGQSLADVLQDLSDASGVRFEAEARIERWGLANIYYHSRAEETAADALRGLCRSWNTIRVEQRWGAWWVFSDQMSEYQQRLNVFPAREAARQFQLMDPDWDPRGVEKWIGQGNRRGAGASVSAWLPDSGILALRATAAQAAVVRGLFEARVEESR